MSTEQILVTSFENDLSWLSNVPDSISITIYNNNLNRRIITRYGFGYFKIPVNCTPRRAKIINRFNNELVDSLYLSYILENYNNLPDKIIIGNYEKTLSKSKIAQYSLDEISNMSDVDLFIYDEPIYTPFQQSQHLPVPEPEPEPVPEQPVPIPEPVPEPILESIPEPAALPDTILAPPPSPEPIPTPESPSVFDDENILAMPNEIMEKFI